MGLSFFKPTSLMCSLILSCSCLSVSPTYTTLSQILQLMAYTTFSLQMTFDGTLYVLPELQPATSLAEIIPHISQLDLQLSGSFRIARFVLLCTNVSLRFLSLLNATMGVLGNFASCAQIHATIWCVSILFYGYSVEGENKSGPVVHIQFSYF